MMTHVERITLIAILNLKISMLKSSLYDYSDAYILVTETITVAPQAGDNSNNGNKETVFKN